MLRMREGCQQAADLGGGHGDEVAYVVAAMVIMPQACPGKLSTAAGAPFELRRPEGRQARAWTVSAPIFPLQDHHADPFLEYLRCISTTISGRRFERQPLRASTTNCFIYS